MPRCSRRARRRSLTAAGVSLFVLALTVAPGSVAGAGPAPAASRLVAIGDVHGAAAELRRLLEAVALIDAAGSWTGGTDVLVQTGDFMDRGEDVREVMELLIRLQGEARAAGGRVVVLLGNHEILDLVGALQYVAPESLAAFAGADAETNRRDAFREYERRVLRRDAAWRGASREQQRAAEASWLAARPLGWVEFLQALAPEGSFGRWLRSLPALHREGDLLFAHAGIPPAMASQPIESINARVHDEIAAMDHVRRRLAAEKRLPAVADLQTVLAAASADVGDLADLAERLPPGAPPPLPEADGDSSIEALLAPLARLDEWLLFAPQGPMWFRGYAGWDAAEARERVPEILAAQGVRALVSGHTPQTDGIRARAQGRLYLIDTGMLESVYGGRGEALVIAGDQAIAVTSSGQRRDLPAPPVEETRSGKRAS